MSINKRYDSIDLDLATTQIYRPSMFQKIHQEQINSQRPAIYGSLPNAGNQPT